MKINLKYKPLIKTESLFKKTDVIVIDKQTAKIIKKIFKAVLVNVNDPIERYELRKNFCLICKNWSLVGKEEIFQLRLIGDSIQVYMAIAKSKSHRIPMFIKLLKEVSTAHISAPGREMEIAFKRNEYNKLMQRCITDGNRDLMRAVLTFPHFDPSANENAFLAHAASNGDLDLVKKLMNYNTVVRTIDIYNNPIKSAVAHEHFGTVAELLKNKKVYHFSDCPETRNFIKWFLKNSSKLPNKNIQKELNDYLLPGLKVLRTLR